MDDHLNCENDDDDDDDLSSPFMSVLVVIVIRLTVFQLIEEMSE